MRWFLRLRETVSKNVDFFFLNLHPDLQKPNMGLGMILDSAVGMFPHKIGPLLQLLTALVSNKSTVKKVDACTVIYALALLCLSS